MTRGYDFRICCIAFRSAQKIINDRRQHTSTVTKCEECDADISIPTDAIEGEIITCAECGASFELAKSADGFNLKPAQTVGEDWGQ